MLNITSFEVAKRVHLEYDYVISILNPGTRCESWGPNHLILRFEDTEHPSPKELQNMKAGVKKALKFAKQIPQESDILVHCHAGISRSPAMAWLICIQRGEDPLEAFQKLYKARPEMWPNTQVLTLGARILKLDENFLKLIARVNAEVSWYKQSYLGYGG